MKKRAMTFIAMLLALIVLLLVLVMTMGLMPGKSVPQAGSSMRCLPMTDIIL